MCHSCTILAIQGYETAKAGGPRRPDAGGGLGGRQCAVRRAWGKLPDLGLGAAKGGLAGLQRELVADTWDRLDEAGFLRIRLDLMAQAADQSPHQVPVPLP